jgi:ADP-ribose pyrophosphatase YjhB (NUDIX family)
MEPIVDAVSREVLEETGYFVEPTHLTGVYQCLRERPILSFAFLCAVVEHRDGPVNESLAIRWCPSGELDALVTYEPHRLRLHDALDFDGSIRFTQYTISPFSLDHVRLLNTSTRTRFTI